MGIITENVWLKDIFTDSKKTGIEEKGNLDFDKTLRLISEDPKIKELFVYLDYNIGNYKGEYIHFQKSLSGPDMVSFHLETTKELRDKIIGICAKDIFETDINNAITITKENKFDVRNEVCTFDEKIIRLMKKPVGIVKMPKIIAKTKDKYEKSTMTVAFINKIRDMGYNSEWPRLFRYDENETPVDIFNIQKPEDIVSFLDGAENILIEEEINDSDGSQIQATKIQIKADKIDGVYTINNKQYYKKETAKSPYNTFIQISGNELAQMKKTLYGITCNIKI